MGGLIFHGFIRRLLLKSSLSRSVRSLAHKAREKNEFESQWFMYSAVSTAEIYIIEKLISQDAVQASDNDTDNKLN